MKRDLKLIAEAYKKVSVVKPKLMVPDPQDAFVIWLSDLIHEVHEDGSVSIDGDVEFDDMLDDRLPFNFKKVTGDFKLGHTWDLTSLEGCPNYVGGNFVWVGNDQIENLLDAPKHIGGDCTIVECAITSLEGGPEYVGKKFEIHDSPNLESLKGAPKYVEGKFLVVGCPKLKNLEGLTLGCESYYIDGFTQQEIERYVMGLELKDTATGDPTFDDFFGLGGD